MLAIRMQRTGRKGHAMYRMVVQDARRTPTSGKIVTYLGSYDPHSKQTSLDKTKASYYLEHGAQPSPRAAFILKSEQVKLPKWVAEPKQMKRSVRNPDKRRSTAPAPEVVAEVEEAKPVDTEAPAEAAATEAEATTEAAVSETEVASVAEAPAEPTEEAK